MNEVKIKDDLMRIVYEVIRDWLQNKLPNPDRVAFDFTPKSSALFFELLRRIKTMHKERGFELHSLVSHVTFEPMIQIVWGDREGTLQPHQTMTLASQLIEVTQASITDAFLFNFLIESGFDQNKAWLMMNEFRNYRDRMPNLRTPQPYEDKKQDSQAQSDEAEGEQHG